MEQHRFLSSRNVRLCPGDGLNVCLKRIKDGDKCGHCKAEERRTCRKQMLRRIERLQENVRDQLYTLNLKLEEEREVIYLAQEARTHHERLKKQRVELHAMARQHVPLEVFEGLRADGHHAALLSGGEEAPFVPAAAAAVPMLDAPSLLSPEQEAELIRQIQATFPNTVTPAQLRASLRNLPRELTDDYLLKVIQAAFRP